MTKKEQCKQLYSDAFGSSPEFDKMLFDLFGDNIETYEKNGTVAAMYFKIPCQIKSGEKRLSAYYIYAVTTHKDFRHRGIMTKLFEKTLTEPDTIYFLKPSSDGVIPFYRQAGFKQICGTINASENTVEVCDNFKLLSNVCDKPRTEYKIMIKGNLNIHKLTFAYTLE